VEEDDLLTTLPGKHQATSPLFQKEIVATPEEVDAVGHVSNVVYLDWIMRVARAHSDAVGYDYPAYEKLGSVFVVKRHEIDYESSAYAGDRIILSTWVESWKAASCIRKTSISRIGDGVILANASTRWALVSLKGFRPVRIPEQVKEAFTGKVP
jgi:acyl-CoA thioester hydrolase